MQLGEPAIEYVPTLHVTHELPPASGWLVPIAHPVHDTDPVPLEYLPATQAVQVVEPTGAIVPARQFLQSRRPGNADFPAAQATQEETAAPSDPYMPCVQLLIWQYAAPKTLPSAQAKQLEAPVLGWYVPMPQLEQAVAPSPAE